MNMVCFDRGYVRYGNLKYEHRIVAELILGRRLTTNEHVHHIDENKKNNHPSNLIVFATNGDHIRHHETPLDQQKLIELPNKTFICIKCIMTLQYYEPPTKIQWLSRSELHKAVWNRSTLKLSKEWGVSDKAIEKRCKKYLIPKPPIGFWNQVENNILKGQSCPLPD